MGVLALIGVFVLDLAGGDIRNQLGADVRIAWTLGFA